MHDKEVILIRRFMFVTLGALSAIAVLAQVATTPSSKLVILPAIAAGLVIGLYEAITLIKDVQVGTHKLGHAVHAIIWALAATFVSFNVDFALSVLPFLKGIPIVSSVIGIRILVGIITAIKVHAISRVTKSGAGLTGLSETWFHTFFIGGLVIAAPYLMALAAPMLPLWLRT